MQGHRVFGTIHLGDQGFQNIRTGKHRFRTSRHPTKNAFADSLSVIQRVATPLLCLAIFIYENLRFRVKVILMLLVLIKNSKNPSHCAVPLKKLVKKIFYSELKLPLFFKASMESLLYEKSRFLANFLTKSYNRN